MAPSSLYALTKVAGTWYLIPFGQAAADLGRALGLDGSGASLWRCLEEVARRGGSLAQVARQFADAQGCEPSARALVARDVRAFARTLDACGALVLDDDDRRWIAASRDGGAPHARDDAGARRLLQIGPLACEVMGEIRALPDGFAPFARTSSPTEAAHLAPDPSRDAVAATPASPADEASRVRLVVGAPPSAAGMRVLVQTGELLICGDDAAYHALFPLAPGIRAMRVSRDGRRATYWLADPRALEGLTPAAVQALSRGATDAPDVTFPTLGARLSFDLFHALRLAFLVRAQAAGLGVLHAASFAYRGRAWLVSAPSGTGKSTHVAQWVRAFGVEQLNGDLCLVGPAAPDAGRGAEPAARPMRAWGVPWCGTSRVTRPFDLPLGGIVLLRRGNEDEARRLPPDDPATTLGVANRMITPTWDEGGLRANLGLAGDLVATVPVWRLLATPEPSAARVMRAAIDGWLDGTDGTDMGAGACTDAGAGVALTDGGAHASRA